MHIMDSKIYRLRARDRGLKANTSDSVRVCFLSGKSAFGHPDCDRHLQPSSDFEKRPVHKVEIIKT